MVRFIVAVDIKCFMGEENVLDTLAAIIIPRAKVDEDLIKIAPRKQPIETNTLPPQVVGPRSL